MIAAIVDQLIQLAVMVAVLIAVGVVGLVVLRAGGWEGSSLPNGLRGNRGAMIAFGVIGLAVILAFLITIGYYIFFEMVWNGQSPGKRTAGIRVLSAEGRPITLGQSMIRNLLRLVDILPSSYMLGLVVMLVNNRSQRLGDIAAGTVVVKVRREESPRLLVASPGERPLAPEVAGAVEDEDVALARDFLLRRNELASARRLELAERIARRLRRRLGPAVGDEPPEALIERVATARRT